MTIVIQLGNTDNKLTQQEWNQFVLEVHNVVDAVGMVHFFGAPPSYSSWQNVCFVAGIGGMSDAKMITDEVTKIRAAHRQDSVAVLIGETQFI